MKELFDYEIRGMYRKMIQTVSNAEARRTLINGSEEVPPVDPERLKSILKG